ncbi:MAG: hypothetical protein LBD59_07620 [Prevotellaceae bacterium]|nr:hypothetical protein [Prevotellaceae bacterium]
MFAIVCDDVETHGVRLCEDCLRRRCAWQCRDGARPVSTVFAGQEIATEQTVPQGRNVGRKRNPRLVTTVPQGRNVGFVDYNVQSLRDLGYVVHESAG